MASVKMRTATSRQDEQPLDLLAQSELLIVAIGSQDVPEIIGSVAIDYPGRWRTASIEPEAIFIHPQVPTHHQEYQQALHQHIPKDTW